VVNTTNRSGAALLAVGALALAMGWRLLATPHPTLQPSPPARLATCDTPADVRQRSKITRGMSAHPGGGIRVDRTPPGSVTEQMHVRAGDIILAVNGTPVSSLDEFARIYREEGLPRELLVRRGNREIRRHPSARVGVH
jgi:membrane-associated protease RseP (regulator of RpoE activity)